MQDLAFTSSQEFLASKNLDAYLLELLPKEMIAKAKKKSGLEDAFLASLALRETLRFLFLGAHRDGRLFFTGNQAVDEIWHFLITETEFYAEFCDRLKRGVFLHHSGLLYSKYCEGKRPETLLEEHFSWLASYVSNFGNIESESLPFIPLASEMMKQARVDLSGLNDLGQRLLDSAKRFGEQRFSWEEFLSSIESNSNQLDRDSNLLFKTIQDLLRGCHSQHGRAPENEELLEIFSRSTALGFTLWQHLAALERIEGAAEWRELNSELYKDIAQGVLTVGLATTHLAKESGSPLRGKKVSGGYLLNGQIPWCTGFSYFEKVIIGFETERGIGFGISKMPGVWAPQSAWTVSRLDLSVLDSTSTITAKIQDLFLADHEILSFREKGVKVNSKDSQYRMPELGMALGTLREVKKKIGGGAKFKSISEALEVLRAEILGLRRIALDPSCAILDQHQYEKSDLIRRAAQLLVLASGGSSIRAGSEVSRRWLETLLLDIVIQPPSLVTMKTEALC
jgi:hypothetical protein